MNKTLEKKSKEPEKKVEVKKDSQFKKKKKIKSSKNKSNLTKLASITTSTLSSAYSKYKKNLEKKKIKEIKLKKLEEKNEILKEQKELFLRHGTTSRSIQESYFPCQRVWFCISFQRNL